MMAQSHFLGFIISTNSEAVDPPKNKAISEWKVRRILGTLNVFWV